MLGYLVFAVYWLWTRTWRFQMIVDPSYYHLQATQQVAIFAHWHGHELGLVHLVKSFRVATLASKSKDGAIMDKVIRLFGGKTSRGSSSRGAVGGLKGLIDLGKRGANISIAVDGPRGPIHKIKPGVFELSRQLRAPIFPIGFACSSAIVFDKSWNKAQLPKPFAKVVVIIAPPLPIADSEHFRSPQTADLLARSIHDASQQALNSIKILA